MLDDDDMSNEVEFFDCSGAAVEAIAATQWKLQCEWKKLIQWNYN